MSVNALSHLNQIATFLKVPVGKMTIDVNSMPVRAHDNKTIKGFMNIIAEFLRLSTSNLNGNSLEDKAEIYQWLEYSIVYATQCGSPQNITQILSELNSVLATKTYFVSYNLSIADIVLYYILQNIMESLTYLEKEKYLHVSRWFDNMQQNSLIRQKNKIVGFRTNYLTTVVPSRH